MLCFGFLCFGFLAGPFLCVLRLQISKAAFDHSPMRLFSYELRPDVFRALAREVCEQKRRQPYNGDLAS